MSISIDELQDQIENLTVNYLEGLEPVSARAIGLDPRAGHSLWLSSNEIVVERHNLNALEYYGGFEYIDSSDRLEIGELIIFKSDDDRVREAIEMYYSKFNG